MPKEMIFHDVMSLTPLSSKEKKRFEFKDSANVTPLIVKLEATHSGYVNGNLCMYTPGGMRASAKTWTEDYNKPVLKNHDDSKDNIGRVINAEYVQTSVDEKTPSMDPLGHILLYARIVDPDAIQKIMDDRYETVSVSFGARDVKCSICGENVKSDNLCEHERGQKYEDKLCYWIVNDFSYKEVSFVNKPADKYAKKLGWDRENVQFGDSHIEPIYSDSFDKEDGMIKFADEATGLNDADYEIAEFIWDGMVKDEDGLFDKKYTSEQRKNMKASAFCGKKDRSFPVTDCTHVTAALRLLKRYKGPSPKSSILSCIRSKAKSLGCKTSSAKDGEQSGLDDAVFALVTGDGEDKIRMYPMDTKENVMDSLDSLGLDIVNSAEDKKLAHTSLSTKAKEFGIKVEQWDSETETEIKWKVIELGDAELEDVLALPAVKTHIDELLKDYVKKGEYDNLKAQVGEEGGVKTALDALDQKIKTLNDEKVGLESQINTRKDEAKQAAKERTDLMKDIHRLKAEKAVILRMALSKEDMKELQTKEDFEKKVNDFAELEKSVLDKNLEDLEATVMNINKPKEQIDEEHRRKDESNAGIYHQEEDEETDERTKKVNQMIRNRVRSKNDE